MRRLMVVAALVALAGCSSGKDEGGPDGVTVPDGLGPEAVAEFGDDSRAFTVIGTAADGLSTPRDLAFHPDRPGELWTVNRSTDATVIYFDAGGPSQTSEDRRDVARSHFMDGVSSIAFGAANTFGTCQESTNGGNDFMGPVLWSADLAIYAQPPLPEWGELGTHLDMLHQSPNCMGIAWDELNRYWVFDGENGHLVYYDFQVDHGPGHDDHSDGIVRRYTGVELTRMPTVTSDMVLDPATGLLYIVDGGTDRILWMDTNTGEEAKALGATNEPLEEYTEWTGAEYGTFARELSVPSGLALDGNRLFLSENGTNSITVFDLADGGKPLGRLTTPAQSIMGLTVGSDGKLWYVDAGADELVRLDP